MGQAGCRGCRAIFPIVAVIAILVCPTSGSADMGRLNIRSCGKYQATGRLDCSDSACVLTMFPKTHSEFRIKLVGTLPSWSVYNHDLISTELLVRRLESASVADGSEQVVAQVRERLPTRAFPDDALSRLKLEHKWRCK